MAVTLTLTGKTPGQTQFGLDTFTEHFKCGEAADLVLLDGSVPQRGDAHPDYAGMFVIERRANETGESASQVDITYAGYLAVQPPTQHDLSKSPFGLDGIVQNLKYNEPAVTALGAAPARGTAHPDYSGMFVTGVRVSEESETGCTVEVTYSGYLSAQPPIQHDFSQSPFGLDQITQNLRYNEPAVTALASAPARGDAHPDFAGMFVIDRRATEENETGCNVAVTYSGYLDSQPPIQHDLSQSPFGLDQIIQNLKYNEPAATALSSAPARGAPHPDYAGMFVVNRRAVEDGQTSSTIQITYSGYLDSQPPIQHNLSQSAFDLDRITENLQYNESAVTALASAPARGDAHPDFAGMFVTERSASESGELASTVSLGYTGILGSLPPTRHNPSKSQFDLDKFTETFKINSSSIDAISAGPQIGDAHPDFAFMFVSNVYANESAEKACELNVVYMGCMIGNGSPTLPADRNTLDNPIQTATSYTSSAIFPLVATVPGSVQYRAHACVLVTWSTSDTSATTCPDPAAVTVDDLITWTLAAEQPAGSFPGIAAWLLENAFVQYIVETTSAEEMVPGQYWQITKRKTMNLYPYAPPS